MIGMYLMNPDGTTRPCTDLKEWAENMEKPGYRDSKIIAQTVAGGRRVVSTVFLGLDHNHGFGGETRPVLFETMIFSRGWGQSAKKKPEVKRLESTKPLARLMKSVKSRARPNMNEDLDSNWQDRYSTIEEARLGHVAAIKLTFDYFPGSLKANKARIKRLQDRIDRAKAVVAAITSTTPGAWA